MARGPDHTLAQSCAEHIRGGFDAYNAAFASITRRARRRFEQRDWTAGRRDAVERIDLYDRFVGKTVEQLEQLLGRELLEPAMWQSAKAGFARLLGDCGDVEFAKTYFSSVTRRVFGTVGINPEIEFVGSEAVPLSGVAGPARSRNYAHSGDLADVFRQVLASYEWDLPYRDIEDSARQIADEVHEHYRLAQDGDSVLSVDVMEAVFFRDTRAYLIGKITGWTRTTPIVVALKSAEDGIHVDAVIQADGDVGRLFGFARSYFHVDLDPVGPAIVFLKRLLPRRPVNELFTVLGRAKQGKTERFRNFASHLEHSHDRFIFAPGEKGLVMLVFTLPSYDVVFKVIRDRFPFPKQTTRERVMERYELVMKHDKGGRLMDTQEFSKLKLRKDRFAPDLLEDLLSETSDTVREEDDDVVIDHVYIERRLRPLNLYVREVSEQAARRAVLDYGAAIRDLAATNLFAGDLLLKNFGVSYHGQVIFYDYDEICLVTECNFRRMPEPRTHEEEMSAEPWFHVGEHDVFPEEFGSFLGLPPVLKAAFVERHGDLLTAEYWQGVQERIRRGEILEVLPY